MSELLTVEGLSIRTDEKVLVSDLSFSLKRGERVGLIGESGSGKSLTALAVTGLLPSGLISTGSVLLSGQQVIDAPDQVLDRVRGTTAAIVFQEPLTALDPLMRVGQQIAEPLARRARRDGVPLSGTRLKDAVLALIDDVALQDGQRIARAYPHELSGGQRQRIAIAMALSCKPDLLIADEPTTALDVTTQAEILGLMNRLVRERQMALLFISHDLPVVANTVESVVVMRLGEAVERGSVSGVFNRPQHEYTKTLVSAAKRFDAALEGRT